MELTSTLKACVVTTVCMTVDQSNGKYKSLNNSKNISRAYLLPFFLPHTSISFRLMGCFLLASFPYNWQRPMPNLSTLAWVEGPCKTRLLKMNRTYHEFGPWLWVEILRFGPHETKPHISCFFCRAVQGNSSRSIRAFVTTLYNTATSHHQLIEHLLLIQC